MPLTPYTVERFGGLNLALDPFEAGPSVATDLLNVMFDRLGRVRTRDGTSQWNDSTLSSSGYSAIYGAPTLTGGRLLVVRYSSGGSIALDQVTTAGTTTSLGTFSAAANTFPTSHSTIGTLTSTTSYVAFATLPSTGIALVQVSLSGPSQPAGAGKPLHLATSPTSNRLVQAGYFAAADSPSGANGSRSTVFFSDVGAPTTYTANNFVTLRPGDGEVITGMAVWQDSVFVFKNSAMFVFYGESTDSDGLPIFNYRRVDLPDPIADPVAAAPFSRYIVAGPDGVYFSTPKGIWRTAGGAPQIMSHPVNKVFSKDPTVSSTVQAAASTPASLSWAAGCLVAAYTASATRQLAWDPVVDVWTLWDLPAFMFAEYPAGTATSRDQLFYVRGSGNNNVFVMKPANTTDSGTAISWSYTSGRYPLSDPGRVAVTLESSVEGSGTVTMAVTTDLYSTITGSATTLGTSPATSEGWPFGDQEGRWFQHALSGSGAAQINRLTHHIQHVKNAGVR